jgi:hypothetical protein
LKIFTLNYLFVVMWFIVNPPPPPRYPTGPFERCMSVCPAVLKYPVHVIHILYR